MVTHHVSLATRAVSKGKRSEDRVEVLECEDVMVVVVADGAGGIRGGAAAADMVVEGLELAVFQRRKNVARLRASARREWAPLEA